MARIKARNLEETSWLAQALRDSIDAGQGGDDGKTACLITLYQLVRLADSGNGARYETHRGKRQIIVSQIPHKLQNALLGLSARYPGGEGGPLVSVLVTHDLNSAVINDLSELVFQVRCGV